ncbi:MAG: hypothetical protein M3016_04060 [Actinomycetota bacterium]|nr:hypothetical protein [Actinomycetota bacterium]
MLFDLRSRGRRRTVQVVYLGLAIVFGLGLILFGVGTGSGGGLLDAFTGNGSSNSQGSVVSKEEKTAERQTKAHPTDPAAWASLINARWASANGQAQQTTAGVQYTAKGKQELTGTTQAWQRYRALIKQADPNLATLAARAYAALGDYGAAADAWEADAQATPNQAKGYACLALSAYSAKQTRKGDLAKAKALALTAKAARKQLSTAIDAAKTTPAAAQSC